MSRPDRRWRPADADRERYAAAISQAFAEGRIDATDMESRTALVYEATSIADLDALVEDMPAPAPAAPRDQAVPVRVPRRKLAGAAAAALFGALAVVLILGAILLSSVGDDAPSAPDPAPAAEAPPPDDAVDVPPPVEEEVELPPIATVKLGLFTVEGLQQLWAAAAGTEPSDLTIRPDRASLTVRADSAHRALATVEYQGGLLLPPDPWRDLGDYESDEEVFFSWADVTPAAVVAAIDATPAAVGLPDVTVGYAIIDHQWDGQVTIRVYLEGDNGIGYVRWDAAGQQVLQTT
ncbi:DUF1707 SHOCT-like domain-containing protein [Jiangella alba]|uniref:DUF1707 domain-containing protein n=1 Tax=Jiangella alba TaxID=561176 RepID=A0A1H5P6B2_9ACTN|nr:DUF1707 domain-containing protein [Jiangella alba]SEF09406.1 protein of unknown function [Jiangella alba]